MNKIKVKHNSIKNMEEQYFNCDCVELSQSAKKLEG